MHYERIEDKLARILRDAKGVPMLLLEVGSNQAIIRVDNCEYKLSLRYNGNPNPRIIDYKTTYQYRAMTALGFTTQDGKSYHYERGLCDVWITFNKGRVVLIKEFDENVVCTTIGLMR